MSSLRIGKVFLLELLLLGLLVFLPVLGERVKQVVNDVSREYLDPQAVCHFLGLPLDFDVERKDHCVSVRTENTFQPGNSSFSGRLEKINHVNEV